MKAPGRGRTVLLILGALWLLASGLAQAGTVHYYYTDPQGTVLAKADAQGHILATYDYAPYGSQALGTPPDGPGYTGHVNDPESGLVYMQARYYDPAVGRFVSTDPVGPGVGALFGFNRYDYANNNPINNIDPFGRCPKGSKDYHCVAAELPRPGGKNVELSANGGKFSNSIGVRTSMAGGDKAHEPLKSVVQDSKGNFKLAPMTNESGHAVPDGSGEKGKPAEGSRFIIHGHLNGMGMTDQPKNIGDAQPLEQGLPNVTVSPDGNRVGVHEIENGVVQFRMLRGSMTPTEVHDIKANLKFQQQMLDKDDP